MNIKNNKIIACLISIVNFALMIFIGDLFLTSGWLLIFLFFVFLPISHNVARLLTGVKIMKMVFK